LTTFRLMAHDTLKAAGAHLTGKPRFSRKMRMLNPAPTESPARPDLAEDTWWRLAGRYGDDAPELVNISRPGELEAIMGAQATWAELRWAGHDEGVIHLEDLLLRRVRLGLLLPEGGIDLLNRMRPILQWELGWDDQRWSDEARAYIDLWRERYSPLVGSPPQNRVSLIQEPSTDLPADGFEIEHKGSGEPESLLDIPGETSLEAAKA
jgi:glycerol-3-phosphate dehydrogenase